MAKTNYMELNDTLRPINKNTVKSIERNSARYIYVNRDRVAKCERCDHEFVLDDVKHRATTKCPKCHRSFEVIHTWRKSKVNTIHWETLGTAVTDTTFVLRYYLVERMDGKIIDSTERARLFLNTDKKETVKFEKSIWTNKWSKSGYSFFREFGMSYARNRYFCMGGNVRPTMLNEINKLDAFKYFDIREIWENSFYGHALGYIIPRASLIEKLCKAGLKELVKADFNNYISSDEIKWNKKATELTKMLGISKNSLNLLKTVPTLKALKILQAMPEITEKEFEVFKDVDFYQVKEFKEMSSEIGCTTVKLVNYIKKQKSSVYEYRTYFNKLKTNNYDVKDHSYAFPKDMVAEMVRLDIENARTKAQLDVKKNALIKAVHDKLMENKALKEFFKGAKGFMAYVPMSEMDFIEEGIAQHNCVGRMGYADKVSKNETLIFFVREIDKPNAPFVTMEYRNGRIIQCMFDHNVAVKHDTKVYDFCTELAKKLNDCKILSA